jgi:hypothetical protein
MPTRQSRQVASSRCTAGRPRRANLRRCRRLGTQLLRASRSAIAPAPLMPRRRSRPATRRRRLCPRCASRSETRRAPDRLLERRKDIRRACSDSALMRRSEGPRRAARAKPPLARRRAPSPASPIRAFGCRDRASAAAFPMHTRARRACVQEPQMPPTARSMASRRHLDRKTGRLYPCDSCRMTHRPAQP